MGGNKSVGKADLILTRSDVYAADKHRLKKERRKRKATGVDESIELVPVEVADKKEG